MGQAVRMGWHTGSFLPTTMGGAAITEPCAVVLVGCRPVEDLRNLLMGGNHVLLIEPDRDRADRLREELGNSRAKNPVVVTEVLGPTEGVATWYTYNDIRRNGTTSPQELQGHYPNLKLLAQEDRPLRPLSDLLQRWQDEDPSVAELFKARRGWWRLDGQMALAAIHTGGPWLECCDRVELSPSAVAAVAGDPDAQAALRSACLASMPRDGFAGEAVSEWRRDQLLEMERNVSLAEKELSVLRSQHGLVTAERDGLLQERQQLTAVRDQLTAQHHELAAQRDQLTAERDGLLQERQQLSAATDQLTAQHHELAAQRDQLTAERDGLLQEREQLTAARDQLTVQHQQLAAQRDQLTAERDGHLQDRDQLTAERDGLIKEREDLMNERDSLKNLNKELKNTQADLERLGNQTEQQLACIKDLFVRVSTARIVNQS
jgi:uncharacterized coiled-coil DUF342 family protein